MSSDTTAGIDGELIASEPTAGERTRSLRRVRQIREFAPEGLTDAEVDAIVDAARWSGSSRNVQPWRFIVLRELDTLRRLAEIGAPQTIPLATAVAAIALVVPADPADAIWVAYDEGRATERILIAAGELGLGAGITWIRRDIEPRVAELLGLPGRPHRPDDRRHRPPVGGRPTTESGSRHRAPPADRGRLSRALAHGPRLRGLGRATPCRSARGDQGPPGESPGSDDAGSADGAESAPEGDAASIEGDAASVEVEAMSGGDARSPDGDGSGAGGGGGGGGGAMAIFRRLDPKTSGPVRSWLVATAIVKPVSGM